MALLGGPAEPRQRLGIVLRDTTALKVHDPEIAPSAGMALLGGRAGPRQRLGIVLRDTHGPCKYMAPRLC